VRQQGLLDCVCFTFRTTACQSAPKAVELANLAATDIFACIALFCGGGGGVGLFFHLRRPLYTDLIKQ
jgi:hypothetical protein